MKVPKVLKSVRYTLAGVNTIYWYVVLLLTTLVFEIAMTVVAFGLKNDAVSEIRAPMIQSVQFYETRRDIAKLWDDLQMEFECCGVAGRNDWARDRIPVSCCHIDYGTVSPFVCTTANSYLVGCASALGEWLSYYAYVIGVVAAVVTGVQITGIVILSVGSSVQSAYNGYHEFLSERFFSLPAFCIATGVIIFIISFFGFYGAYMENYYMNMAFAGSMILMFIFQLSACIAGYALKGNTVALVQQSLMGTMDLYGANKNLGVTKLWDEMQEDFSCCGVANASDWLLPLGTTETLGVPVSCCDHVYGTIQTFVCNVTVAYNVGCTDAFGSWVQSHAAAIGITGIFMVLLQALAVAGAVWLAKISRQEHAFP
ncbi:CD63 antigen [Papilio xuthus]|uniref:CD63 antigen n=1 Tax=Papilio xuthus TaxID=66420 RepID=A0A194Q3J6_PAPXU|nr:CD63 antigen [Papilio xuthus]